MATLFKQLSAEERIAEHRRIKARGMVLFIFVRGVLGFGAFAFLIDLGSSALFEHRHIDLEFLIAKCLQWSSAGLFFGWFNWRVEFDADEDASLAGSACQPCFVTRARLQPGHNSPFRFDF